MTSSVAKSHLSLLLSASLSVPEIVCHEIDKNLSRLMGKPTKWFPTRSDTNRAVQAQKMAGDGKFRI